MTVSKEFLGGLEGQGALTLIMGWGGGGSGAKKESHQNYDLQRLASLS